MASPRVQIGEFELDPPAYELRRLGRPVRLERIPMELLLLLVSRKGELVTRAEIIEKLWGNDVYIDTNTAINVAIRKIRQALRDDPDNPRFVQTVAGKGYRFIGANGEAAVEEQPVAAPKLSLVSEPPTPVAADVPLGRRSRSPIWIAIGCLVLIAGVVVGLVHFRKSPAAATGKVMLVVLPFRNFSGDPAQDFLADGMTEELITQVGSLNPERLGVIARTSAMQYQNTQKDTAAIARELGVNYLIEGSIRRAGNRIRVTAQLIQTSDQTHIWAESFDRNVSDVLQIQSEIASAVANKVQIALSQQTRQRLLAERHVQPEAYEAYLEGLQAWNQRSRESEEKAVAAFQRAIAIDPQYALAYGALARAYALAPVFALQPPAEMMPKARDAALHAVAIDDSLAEAHTVLGFVKAHYDFDWPGAEREFVRALELNSSCATAYLFYSNAYLSPHGQHEAAIAELQKGIQLNPLSTPMVSYLGRTYIWARRYDEALAQLQKAEKMDPNFAVTHERMARVYAYMGNYQQAIDEDEKARLLSGEDAEQVIRKRNRIRRALAERGARGYWETLLEFSRDRDNPSEAYVTPFGIAIIQARLGNKDRAIEFLEQAYEQRDTYLTSVAVEPAFDNLRDEPRFAELLQKVGLSQ